MLTSLTGSLPTLRRLLTWSNSPQAWLERGGIAATALGAGLLWHFGSGLSAAWQTALWALLLLLAAVLLRRGWLTIFGPVLFYELVRVARRQRYFLLRGLYALTLAGVFLWLYFLWILDRGGMDALPPREMAVLAESFFTGFMLVQFCIVTLLVPALTGSAVAEEKERKTLDFLLATDLRNREIVLSKLVARLANVALIVLTGLPILSLVQFLGGIPPDLLLAGFAALGLTVLSMTCLGILFSVLLTRSRDAIMVTYLTVGAYLALASMALVLDQYSWCSTFPIWFGDFPPTVHDLIERFNAGNLLALIIRAEQALAGNMSLSAVLPGLMGEYFVFHGLIALVCAALAVLRLRAAALKQTGAGTPQTVAKLPLWRRPRLKGRPMLWKELHVEGGLRLGKFGTFVLVLLVPASFAPAVILIADMIPFVWNYQEAHGVVIADAFGMGIYRFRELEWIQDDLNVWARIVGAVVASLMLIGVAVRAAGSLGGERARQTLDSLLTTPLESRTILGAKWLGSILHVRRGWLWLGMIWLLVLPCGALHFLAVPLIVVAWCVYAAGCATLGLWFSLVCRTTLRATIWTLSALFMLTAGQWLVAWLFLYLPLSISDGGGSLVDSLAQLQLGQTPPIALGMFGFRIEDFVHKPHEFEVVFVSSVLNLAFWGVGTAVLWSLLLVRFNKLSGRFLMSEATAHRKQSDGSPAASR